MTVIERAALQDTQEILALQKLAYQSEAAIYGDYTIPPLRQTVEEMMADLRKQVVLKAVVDGQIVGSVRACERDGTCYIGRLIVHPDSQNRGIGTRLMHEVEAAFADAERFELFTGSKSERNLYLYRKLGYVAFREQQLTDLVSLVYLEKRAPVGPNGAKRIE
jgi:ribosomal protein S18 acetylase RimI-like enzyme